jgi:hypothetical protein
MRLRIAAVGLLAAALASCGPRGMQGQLAEIRAEIQLLERSIPPESPLWPNDGENAFNKFVEDYTPRIPDFIYNHVIGKLSAMTDSQVEAMAQPGLSLESVTADPAAHRGRILRVTGHIASLTSQRYEVEVGKARREVFQGALFIGEKPILFHLATKPDVVYLGSDTVDFSGVFVKILTYPSPSGKTVSAPFFLARSLRKFY